tara:strand:- start:652 stop:1632 length:981 start_codon:yes stop_codon:yes gene_type:complete
MVHTHLVTWQEFMKEKENKDLPILEAKAKYLKLQRKFELLMEAEVAAYNAVALNSVMDGSQGGDPSLINPITNIVFSDVPTKIELGNDPVAVTATFTHPVLVTGAPSLKIHNGQQGGGTANNIVLGYSSGSGTKTIVFNSTQVSANTSGNQPIGAGKLIVGEDLKAIESANTLSGVTTAASTTGVLGVASGGENQEDVTLTIENLSDGTIVSAAITSIASSATAYYNIGDTITVAASELTATTGASGGSVVFTITNTSLVGDILELATAVEFVQGGFDYDDAPFGVIGFDASNYITTTLGEKLGYENYMTYSGAIIGGFVEAEANG